MLSSDHTANEPARLVRGIPGRLPWNVPLSGELVEFVIASNVLQGNRLGDPAERPVWVYLPPSYRESVDGRFPVVYMLHPMTYQVSMWLNRSGFHVNPIEMFDMLFSRQDVAPCILVFVDCWTSLGGSQFLDSPGTGNYHSFLCNEVVPAVDSTLRTQAQREHRGIAGHSSGGYGAITSALLRPDLFSAVVSHAGDALFEYCYMRAFPAAARALRDKYDSSYERFWAEFRARPALPKPDDFDLINTYCMAACYSSDAAGKPLLPFDVNTGQIIADTWRRWLAWDPVQLIGMRPDAARNLKAVYLDAGTRDEYYLDLGAVAMAKELRAAGVTDVHLDLFEGEHVRIQSRYAIGLEYVARRLA